MNTQEKKDFTLLRCMKYARWKYICSQVAFSVSKQHMIIFAANAKDLAGFQFDSNQICFVTDVI